MINPVSDEELVAFLHGELDEGRLAEVEAALAADPELARRAEDLAGQDQAIRDAFAPILMAETPEHLRAIVEPGAASSAVIDFATAKARRRPTAWSWPQFGAMAASLALGIFAGSTFLTGAGSGGGAALVVPSDAGLAVSGQVAAALSSAESGKPVQLASLGEMNVAITFKAHDGRVCRQFSLRSADQIGDGVACREGGSWKLEALGSRSEASGEMRTASGDASPAVVTTVDSLISGEPLVAEAEAEALRYTKAR